ncbi:MAG: phosphatidylinositol-specific phospholipase C domain-containing protein, partial [Candidatus Dormibacteraceae bacterium]
MGGLVSHASWMRDIPDDTPVTVLSIPGTHDSGCIGGPLGVAQTQDLDLFHQLDAGIRFLDIRLAQYQDDLVVHHDVVCMGKNYTEVLDICSSFLKEHPSETILMSVKDEDRVDSGLGRYAPSELLGKLSMGDTPDADQDTSSFDDVLQTQTWERIGDAPLFYNFVTPGAGDDSPTLGSAFTSETTLGDVRGKIILLRRFDSNDDVGLDLTYWPDNQTFRSAAPPVHVVHDRYQG